MNIEEKRSKTLFDAETEKLRGSVVVDLTRFISIVIVCYIVKWITADATDLMNIIINHLAQFTLYGCEVYVIYNFVFVFVLLIVAGILPLLWR